MKLFASRSNPPRTSNTTLIPLRPSRIILHLPGTLKPPRLHHITTQITIRNRVLISRLRIQVLQLNILNLNSFTPTGGSATLHESDLVVIERAREVVHGDVADFEGAAVAVAGGAAERSALRDGESGAADAGEGEVCEGDVANV